MYSTLLVPLDGSTLAEAVLPYAVLLGKAFRSEVRLLRIYVLPYDDYQYSYVPYSAQEQVIAYLRESAQNHLSKVALELRKEELTVATIVEEGQPASQILAHAGPDTLTIMSTHGRSGVLRLALGSVTTKVITASKGPILVVRPRQESADSQVGLTRVVVPLDGSLAAEEALSHATGLAKALSLQVDLVRVAPPRSHDANGFEGYHDLLKRAETTASDYLDDVAARVRDQGVSSITTQVLTGEAAPAVLESVQHSPSTIIAMTTHGRSGLQRWILGSVADFIIRQSNCPVLLVRAQAEAE